jgi:hypothetical protein
MSGTEECPLSPVEQRLEDCHRQWHDADNAYFDPDEFRLRIQTCIQSLRTVTFILQKNQTAIPDFESWYAGWQDHLRNDKLMSWMVNARNKIEKQGDLKLHSIVKAGIVASYLDSGPVIEVPAKLFEGPRKLLKSIPRNAVGDHVRKHGVLRIQRRWVENSLPEYELLDAVAIAYGKISELLDDAHRQIGSRHRGVVNVRTGQIIGPGDRDGRLPCMIEHEAERSLLIRLKDGARMKLQSRSVQITPEDEAEVEKESPVDLQDIFPGIGSTADETLASLFETARRVFLRDKYHDSIMFLLEGSRPVRIIGMQPEDQAEKYLLMRRTASEALKLGADGVILLGEVWSAPFDPKHPFRRPADAPNPLEYLTGTLVRKEGEPIQLMAQIKRGAGEVELGETIELRDVALWSYAPFYRAWKRALPEQWRDPGAKGDFGNSNQ